MPRMSKMGALKIADPPKWKKAVLKAMEECGGRIPDAATKLDVSGRQLFRWLMEPEFKNVDRVGVGVPREGSRGKRKKPAPKVVDLSNNPTRKKKRKEADVDVSELADYDDNSGAGED